MSKVKIQGNASGTGVLTVTAPNTSTDRTITLPDSTGTLATTGDITTYPITTTASNNIGVGTNAVDSITTGDDNVGVGVNSLTSVTTGSNNTAIGVNSLYTHTTGNKNTGIGRQALYNNTTSDGNTAIGYNSLFSNTTASQNTAMGREALFTNTTGADNVAVGSAALYSNTTAVHNTAVGRSALINNSTGVRNTAVGFETLRATTTGSDNVAIGYEALESVTTGTHNIGIGHRTGDYNNTVTTGNFNILIGGYCHTNSVSAGRQIVMGDSAIGSADNSLTIGNGGQDSNIIMGQTSWTAPSDIRLKEDIQDAEAGLDFINDLRPVTYKWKKEKDIPEELHTHKAGSEKRFNNDYTNHGFIAQEVKEAIDNHPEIKDGFEMWSEDSFDGRQRIGEGALITILTKAVQELSAKVKALEEA